MIMVLFSYNGLIEVLPFTEEEYRNFSQEIFLGRYYSVRP
jgi:hypothetical protein